MLSCLWIYGQDKRTLALMECRVRSHHWCGVLCPFIDGKNTESTIIRTSQML
ncbi:hypothetical protein [Roseofilum sp. SID1]|nr:hypothetical protein [Roseofilum sp. SID1]